MHGNTAYFRPFSSYKVYSYQIIESKLPNFASTRPPKDHDLLTQVEISADLAFLCLSTETVYSADVNVVFLVEIFDKVV